MTIYLGGTKINDIKIGSTPINKVYKGSQLIWSRIPISPDSGWNNSSSSGINNNSATSNNVTITENCTLKITTTISASWHYNGVTIVRVRNGSTSYLKTWRPTTILANDLQSGQAYTASFLENDQIYFSYSLNNLSSNLSSTTVVVNNANNDTLDTFTGTHSGTAGSGGGGGCFLADSQITLADLSTKPITEIKAGDRVLGDGMVNEVVELREIEQQSRTIYSINHLKTTDSHPILTSDGWKAIDPLAALEIHPEMTITELKAGDSLVCVNESGEQFTQIVNSITSETLNTKVYNLNVTGSDTPDREGNDTYVVDNVVVHNK